ncbi:type IV secretion system protein VirB11 [Novosphingobium sp. PhB57]|jgi:type IV secretion system protein VirB11|uniref:P-type DNA transfer ATPase VirB11 n=1 Tax=unclassified Novosphingobium TaxID=2644732 RepID=UPI0010511589|nr:MULTISPECIES: P-type DNA transfer ATPase VirB11 [unclassified Novosphingobium]TCU62183.1 type IV secretion system protein VirB11 [Novosphingobium sp. PhB57]TDW62776.1 type IV secretion system protein VirB11 [Novosphingobium sp. PhB55]
MVADVFSLQPERSAIGKPVTDPEAGAGLSAARSVYLDAYLAPLRPWLDRETVTEILVNRPGEIWVEDAAHPGMQHIRLPEMDNRLLQRLAEQVARISHQGINREHPLLSATLPGYGSHSGQSGGGARIQLVGPPATRSNWAMAIRRHRLLELPLDAYDRGPIAPLVEEPTPDPMAEPIAFLRDAIRRRRTILISGGTSTGKTTFLNAMLSEIPQHERVVVVEDTAELRLPGANGVGLIAVKGELGEAKVSANDLLQAALRLRPDRIVLGELRGSETVSFLRAINTGHPGSFSTVHANTPRGALEQIALMSMQTGIGLTRAETLEYAASVIDIVVQLDRQGGKRGISQIAESATLVG